MIHPNAESARNSIWIGLFFLILSVSLAILLGKEWGVPFLLILYPASAVLMIFALIDYSIHLEKL